MSSRRRASVYLLTLGTATLVVVIGLAALTTARLQSRAAVNEQRTAAAQHLADGALHSGLYLINNLGNWRATFDDGWWFEEWPLADARRRSLFVTDPVDGDLNDDLCDELHLTGYGLVDGARQAVGVTLRPDALDDEDPLPPLVAALRPVAYWRLGDVGTIVRDEENLHAGTYHHGVEQDQPVPYRCDGAAWFDGHNDYVEIPHSDNFLIDEGAIHLWIYPLSDGAVFSKDSSGYDTGGHVNLAVSGARLEVRLQRDSDNYYLRSGSLSFYQWHHVVFTFGDAGMRLYINGSWVDWDSYDHGLRGDSNDRGNFEPIALGVGTTRSGDETVAGWDDAYRGYIDEVALFDHQLTGADVYDLFVAGSDPPPATMHFVAGTWQRVVD